MKNQFLTALLLLLLFATAGYGQPGIKGGLNLSNLYTNDENIGNRQPTLGYQAGLFLEIPVSERFSIQPEGMYTRKGAKYETLLTEVDANLTYIDIPVVAVFKPQLLPLVRLHVGPQFSWLTNVEYEFESQSGAKSEVDTDKDNYNEWDVGLALGASLHINKWLLEMRFTQGFKSIEKPREIAGVSFGDADLKNFNLQLSTGFFF